MASPIYRSELDIVAEATDGSLCAYGIGWFDPRSSSVLFEPKGTDPNHSQRGLARAVCAEILRTAAGLGATHAVVDRVETTPIQFLATSTKDSA